MKLNVLLHWKTKSLLLSVFVFGLCTFGWAANISSTVPGGNWNATTSWVGGVIPGLGDVVTIGNGSTITVTSNTTVTSVTLNSGGTLNLAANLTGDVILNGGTLINASTVSPSVTGNLTSIGNNSSTITVNGSTSTLYISGNITTDLSGTALLTTNGPGLLNVANFTLGAGDDAVISQGGKMLVRSNLTLENQSKMTVDGVLVVKGTFETANNGNITTTGNGAFSAQGNVVRGTNTVTNSLSYCPAPDPCAYALEDPTTQCNRVCIALGGFPGNGGTTTLPVTLVQFSVVYEQVQAQVRLAWTTSSETNNNFFTIERSTDAIHYEVIETVKGAGNSRESLAYVTYDPNPLPGTSYYRLKQTDFDSQSTYYKPMAVENRNQAKFGFNLVPNPGNGQQMNLALKGEGMDQVLVSVYGHLGQMVYESVASVTDGNQLNIQFHQSLPNGIYWVKVRKGNETVTRQMLVSNL